MFLKTVFYEVSRLFLMRSSCGEEISTITRPEGTASAGKKRYARAVDRFLELLVGLILNGVLCNGLIP